MSLHWGWPATHPQCRVTAAEASESYASFHLPVDHEWVYGRRKEESPAFPTSQNRGLGEQSQDRSFRKKVVGSLSFLVPFRAKETPGGRQVGPSKQKCAAVAQLVEHLPSKQDVVGSSPISRSRASQPGMLLIRCRVPAARASGWHFAWSVNS